MELWIRSQDKKHLLKVDNIKWFGGELYTNDSIFLETIKDGVRYLLGIYSNGKRALEVFDEIQKLLKPSVIYRKYHNEIKEGKNNLEFTLEMTPDNESIDIIQPTTIVYEMPKE